MNESATISAEPVVPAPQRPERRREARLTMVTKGTLFPVYDLNASAPDYPNSPRRVFLRDISLLGCGFRTTAPFETGQRWRLKVEAGPMRYDGHVEVLRCEPAGNKAGFEIGTRFITTELPPGHSAFRPAQSIPRNPCRHLTPRK